jgi:hypothetical protein
MKSRVFTFTSLLALIVAMAAASSAFAQSTPAQDVYNPNGEVLDVVAGGGQDNTTKPQGQVKDDVDSGSSVCAAANGKDANGNAVSYGSAADCATAGVAPSVCSAADGKDANGNAVTYASAADCATATPTVASGSLPFTGFQAGLVALAGIALLGAGLAMRRVTRHDAI